MRATVRLLVLGIIAVLLAGLVALPRAASAQEGLATAQVSTAQVSTAHVPTVQEIAANEVAAIRARAAETRRLAAVAKVAQAAAVMRLRTRVIEVARKQLGDRYSAGSAGPNAFDCSGLTLYVYRVATGRKLPHQSHAQYAKVKKVSRKQAQPGDLVFFFRNGAHHVGIYIGNGRMIDAPGYGKPVRVSPISGSWWSRTYSGMGRLLPAAQTKTT